MPQNPMEWILSRESKLTLIATVLGQMQITTMMMHASKPSKIIAILTLPTFVMFVRDGVHLPTCNTLLTRLLEMKRL